jgi:serine/threonine protein kinase
MGLYVRAHPSLVQPGDIVSGKYRVERLLGAGGMGVVVAARHLALGQLVAMKLIEEALTYVLQAAEGIAEAHAAGIVQETQTLGSPLYMSPEQMTSPSSVDARSDIWSLGVLLYELLAGRTPFHTNTLEQLRVLVLSSAPAPLTVYRNDIPGGLATAIEQCLEKDPSRRWPHIAAFAAALAPFAPPRAASYIERVAGVLGCHVTELRRTDELSPVRKSSLEQASW